jgi:hypothetical protein
LHHNALNGPWFVFNAFDFRLQNSLASLDDRLIARRGLQTLSQIGGRFTDCIGLLREFLQEFAGDDHALNLIRAFDDLADLGITSPGNIEVYPQLAARLRRKACQRPYL